MGCLVCLSSPLLTMKLFVPQSCYADYCNKGTSKLTLGSTSFNEFTVEHSSQVTNENSTKSILRS